MHLVAQPTVQPTTYLPFTRKRSTARQLGTLCLPAYARDGRKLEWSPCRTAVMFDSTPGEYFSDKFAVSSTDLRKMAQSAAHMRSAQLNPKKETASQRLGSAVHCRLFEPTRFRSEYLLFDGRRAGWNWEAFKARNAGKEILNRKEWDQVGDCLEAISCATALTTDAGTTYTVGDLIAHGQCERTIYWLDEETGLTCKARPDLMVQHVTADLKTTDDARVEAFSMQAGRNGYHIQAAHYLRGRKAFLPEHDTLPMLFICAEVDAPHGVQVHSADQSEFIEWGEKKRRELMQTYRESVVANRWSSYPQSGKLLKLPVFMRYPGLEL